MSLVAWPTGLYYCGNKEAERFARVEDVIFAVLLTSADRKPVDLKRKRQAFSSLFFVLLMSFIIKQDEKRE